MVRPERQPRPSGPDSPVERCTDCTSKYLAERFGQRGVEDKRKAAMTRRASVDAILLAQATLGEDDDAGTSPIVEPFAPPRSHQSQRNPSEPAGR
jgi:hypothetical protein